MKSLINFSEKYNPSFSLRNSYLAYRRFTLLSFFVIFSISKLSAQPIVGEESMLRLDLLPRLWSTISSGQQSSFDRTGANLDWNNFLYVSNGENVLLDEQGPGVVDCIWTTGFDLANYVNKSIKVYFDGESTPRINTTIKDLFSGVNPLFLSPIANNDAVSSGGMYSYIPIPFSRSIKVTTNGTGFYHVGYRKLMPNRTLTSWNSNNISSIKNLWLNVTKDPKPTVQGNTTTSNTIDLATGQSQTLLDADGPRSISSIRIKIPDLVVPFDYNQSLTDNGRAFKGYSQFTMAIDPSNQGVRLQRRFAAIIGNPKANVLVDGVSVGQWFNQGWSAFWVNSSFNIPSSFTSGKSTITIRINFVSSDVDWNEFYYWAYSKNTDGTELLTDAIDVGNTLSENAHSYTINTQTWAGSNTWKYQSPDIITDDGRAFKGYCQFTMAIDPTNEGVRLQRRLDYSIADQKANISVDGVAVGQWFNAGTYGQKWLNSSFDIPSTYTSGKSSITVKIDFVSSAIDWNEFYYWIYSKTGSNTETATDSLDVGKTTSENAHAYTINTQTWTGSNSFTYPLALDSKSQAILNNTNLVISWDNSETPAVDVPIGSFFAMGQFGSYATKSLMLGVDSLNYLYCYFPMPYNHHTKLQLVNSGSTALNNIHYEIKHTPVTESFDSLGYFYAKFNHEIHTANDGKDIKLLDVSGSGKFLGVMVSMQGNTNRTYLEGDERFYIDYNQSPAFYGTGTEDFYQGGWYFGNGPFTLPMHGNTAHWVDTQDKTAAYRFFLHDAINFRTHITAGVEHGNQNDAPAEYWSTAYYYLNPLASAIFTDSIEIGNSNSETNHSFSVGTLSWTHTQNAAFDGVRSNYYVSKIGKATTDYSQFTMAIEKSNNGVILRRTFDQYFGSQKADVYVDNMLVGTWNDQIINTNKRFREDEFMIPAQYTRGKSNIQVKLVVASDAPQPWNAFYYKVLSLKGSFNELNVINTSKYSRTSIYPNPFTTSFKISIPENIEICNASIKIFDICGKEQRSISINGHQSIVNRDELQKGMYLYNIFNNNEQLDIGKIIIE